MKKVVKLFLLVITCLFVFSLTSCAKGSFKEAELVKVEGILNQNGIVLDRPEEGKTFVGYFTFDEESKTGTLYLVGAIIPEGEYEPVYDRADRPLQLYEPLVSPYGQHLFKKRGRAAL